MRQLIEDKARDQIQEAMLQILLKKLDKKVEHFLPSPAHQNSRPRQTQSVTTAPTTMHRNTLTNSKEDRSYNVNISDFNIPTPEIETKKSVNAKRPRSKPTQQKENIPEPTVKKCNSK